MLNTHLHELNAEKQLSSEFLELPAPHYPDEDSATFLAIYPENIYPVWDTRAIHTAIHCATRLLEDSTFFSLNHWASDALTYRIVQPSKSSTHLQQK